MLYIFYVTSILVVIALLIATYSWYQIAQMRSGKSARGAQLFVGCFLLYVVGQSLVILDVAGFLKDWGYLASYMYAVASILFAAGSYMMYKSEASRSTQ
jgi:hypothetical protein